MKIAIEGCAHGELENIYNTIEYIEKQNNITVDLLLCCGDFQATRNLDDLNCMAVPPKFRSICTFYKYFSGEKLAPKLTIFIGGNHEASNYLQELPYGGWVAPNIYYLGYAGVVNVGGIRIAGLSGIFKGYDFARGRFEKPPYDADTIRSCYHFRNLDVFRLKQLSPPVHIMLSHDWPAGVENYGDVKQLLKLKPFFKEEIKTNSLGNEPAFELLQHMKPDYWFAAHLHVKFAAVVEHKDESGSKKTKFLSLDKCLPQRKFLQIVDIPQESDNEIKLKYDLEWLAILQITNHLLSVKKLNNYMPGPSNSERWIFTPSKEEMDSVMKRFQDDLNIPNNFVPTAPAYNPNERNEVEGSVKCTQNPQTVEFCEKLGIDDPMSLLLNESGLNVTGSGVNMSSLEFSSFIEPSKPEIDISSPRTNFVRTPLKLPTPNVELHDKEENILTSTPIEKAQTKVLESESTENSFNLEPNPEEPESNVEKPKGASEPWPKKFKRRNMALYASNDDD